MVYALLQGRFRTSGSRVPPCQHSQGPVFLSTLLYQCPIPSLLPEPARAPFWQSLLLVIPYIECVDYTQQKPFRTRTFVISMLFSGRPPAFYWPQAYNTTARKLCRTTFHLTEEQDSLIWAMQSAALPRSHVGQHSFIIRLQPMVLHSFVFETTQVFRNARWLQPPAYHSPSTFILYCTLFYCFVVHHTVSYSIMLYGTLLYSTLLYYTILDYTILYYTILYYTILYYTILYYTILYYILLYYTILYYTILYYTILYYTILYYAISYSISL